MSITKYKKLTKLWNIQCNYRYLITTAFIAQFVVLYTLATLLGHIEKIELFVYHPTWTNTFWWVKIMCYQIKFVPHLHKWRIFVTYTCQWKLVSYYKRGLWKKINIRVYMSVLHFIVLCGIVHCIVQSWMWFSVQRKMATLCRVVATISFMRWVCCFVNPCIYIQGLFPNKLQKIKKCMSNQSVLIQSSGLPSLPVGQLQCSSLLLPEG